MQFNASLSKEIKFFMRSHKFLAIILVLLGLSVLDPVIIKAFSIMTESLSTTFETQAENSAEMDMSEVLDEAIGSTSESASGVVSFVGDASTTGLLVAILLLMGVAGKEQKRRATIIPACSGLKTNNYLLPKFLVYPTAIFLMTVVSSFACYFISVAIFETNTLTVEGVFISSIFLGFYLAFTVCVHLFIGLSTSRPGLSAGIVITLSYLLPVILLQPPLELADKYNPIALKFFAAYALTSKPDGIDNAAYNISNISASVFITVVLIILMYFLTLFIQNAKKVDNSGNDTLL